MDKSKEDLERVIGLLYVPIRLVSELSDDMCRVEISDEMGGHYSTPLGRKVKVVDIPKSDYEILKEYCAEISEFEDEVHIVERGCVILDILPSVELGARLRSSFYFSNGDFMVRTTKNLAELPESVVNPNNEEEYDSLVGFLTTTLQSNIDDIGIRLIHPVGKLYNGELHFLYTASVRLIYEKSSFGVERFYMSIEPFNECVPIGVSGGDLDRDVADRILFQKCPNIAAALAKIYTRKVCV